MVGTAIEFYDNYCYSIAAASYFGTIFFPAASKANPALGTMYAFLTFAVSFLARPFGSMLFGHFGDKIGRKTTLVVSLMTMGVGTFLIGCLPTYSQVGVGAVAVLCLLRFIQASALAANGPVSCAGRHRERARRQACAVRAPSRGSGAPIGFFLSNGTYFVLESFNDTDAMCAWGWRVPFLLSAVLVIVGLVVRVQMEETPIFRMAQEQKKVVKSPLTEVFKKSVEGSHPATFLVAVHLHAVLHARHLVARMGHQDQA